LSGVLRYIAERIGKLEAAKELDLGRVPIRWALGHAVEEFVASLYPDFNWQPGEMIRAGIICSADGTDFAAGWLEEVKSTEEKVRRGQDFLNEWLWMQQGRGECAIWGMDTVRWHVWYLRGNYDNQGPQYWRYLVRFSEEEIENTWKMILAHKHGAQPE
jgi:hypothetical protein